MQSSDGSKDEKRKVAEKIKKILAKVRPDTPIEEQKTALFLAEKLMRDHKLSQADLESEDPGELVIVDCTVEAESDVPWWKVRIAALAGVHFGVVVYTTRVGDYYGDDDGLGDKERVRFVGDLEDVEVAAHWYHAMCGACVSINNAYMERWLQANPEGTRRAQAQLWGARLATTPEQIQRDYMAGIIQGISDELDAQVANPHALALRAPKEANDLVQEITGGAERPNDSPTLYNRHALALGHVEGRQLASDTKGAKFAPTAGEIGGEKDGE